MRQLRIGRRQFLAGLLAVAATAPLSAAPYRDPHVGPRHMPSFITVERTVREHFAKEKILTDDLLSQGQVKPIFALLKKQGWDVADQESILQQILEDKSYLVRTLRKGRGRDFAHSAAKFPGGYDRVDRLSRLPHGHTFLEGLISTADGYKMIEYMTETPGGHVLGMQIEHAPKGRKFNTPTGRIYTVNELMMRLRESYDAATHPAVTDTTNRRP